MFNKKLLVVVLSILTIISVGSVQTNPIQIEQKNTVNIATKLTGPTTLIKHNPFNITNNAELATMATSGSGSKISPYIIENLLINTCTANETGIHIQNTNKYFVLRNINVVSCNIGIFLLNVSFGTIKDSFVTNYPDVGFLVSNSSNNILIDDIANNHTYNPIYVYVIAVAFAVTNHSINNTIMDCTVNNAHTGFVVTAYSSFNTLKNNKFSEGYDEAFEIYNHSSYNLLANNFVYNYYYKAFDILAWSNNNILLNNTAIDGNWGFFVGSFSNNTVLKDNTGFDNYVDFNLNPGCTNTSVINNKFIIKNVSETDNNDIAYSFPLSLFSPITILTIIGLLGLYSGIGYNYYSFKKINKSAEESGENQQGTKGIVISKDDTKKVRIRSFIDVLLVSISILPSTNYITVVLDYSSLNRTYNSSNIFQLAPLSGILLLGGEIISVVGVVIYLFSKSFKRWNIAKDISLIGLSTQVLGFILSLLVYAGIMLSISTITSSTKVGSSHNYTVLPAIGLVLCFIGVIFALFSYKIQRKWSGQ